MEFILLDCLSSKKEQVCLIHNKTVSHDTIYNSVFGYRQERIKVLGYRTTDWNGGFNVPRALHMIM